ncbi:hypothetical protein Taro_041704 [Colocasia esculenta]|uniref:UBC core domain-containing protein n=1 Tax=Colocasia esculenta TaxID=4460 RepID=A0A843WY03_COLES|nr:hypothetical protein [Colocasia esculenta]
MEREWSASSSYGDLDVMEVTSLTGAAAASWSYNQQKRKRSQVVGHDVIEIDDDEDDPAAAISKSTSNNKSKQVMEGGITEKESDYNLAAKFDNLDLPPGVEASVPLWQRLSSETTTNRKVAPSKDWTKRIQHEWKILEKDLPAEAHEARVKATEANASANLADARCRRGASPHLASSPRRSPRPPSISQIRTGSRHSRNQFCANGTWGMQGQATEANSSQVQVMAPPQYLSFPQPTHSSILTGKALALTRAAAAECSWPSKLQETIFVRAYEERMDLLRAVIVGPAGTPYHDGLFFFDCFFPSNYPDMPPQVHYHSGGLRLNPNLYACGKVCLSLLGTWGGNGCEKWKSGKSTMLQVLVSIQALVLNAKPYFNEPGYEASANTAAGEKKSLAYNEETFLLSCNTMIYSLRRPPKASALVDHNFEDFVAGHFCKYGGAILLACRAYMDGTQVGCVVGDGVQAIDEGDKCLSSPFQNKLKKLFEELLMEFTVKGADCDVFLAQKAKAGLTKGKETFAPDTTLRL